MVAPSVESSFATWLQKRISADPDTRSRGERSQENGVGSRLRLRRGRSLTKLRQLSSSFVQRQPKRLVQSGRWVRNLRLVAKEARRSFISSIADAFHASNKALTSEPETEDEGTQQPNTIHRTVSMDAESDWNTALHLAGEQHKPEYDAPVPPARSQGARGCLEVELLGFSNLDARLPICQFMLDSLSTGALCPLGGQGSSRFPQNRARFAVWEIAGCDLRVHIFDIGSLSFTIGREEKAFYGGAIVPLTALVTPMDLASRVCTAELSLSLLPIEAMCGRRQKLQPGILGATGQRRIAGTVRINLRLTLFDMPPVFYYVDRPFQGLTLVGAKIGRREDPKSVVECVAAAWRRLRRALVLEPWFVAKSRMSKHAASMFGLHALWAFSALCAPLWAQPGCVAAVVMLLLFHMPRHARQPLDLYADTEETPNERGIKRALGGALKTADNLLSIAESLNRVAAGLEKFHYLVTLRDPSISGIVSGLVLALLVLLSVQLWLLTLVLASLRAYVRHAIWIVGCLALLPPCVRKRLRSVFNLLQKIKRHLLPGNVLLERLKCLWQRIPDAIEAEHCELCKACLDSSLPQER